MFVNIVKTITAIYLYLLIPSADASASSLPNKSMHFGLMHPNGVDVVGYSVEKPLTKNVYSFYNFGFPSLAAVGLSYYENYNSNGLTSAIGVGIGSILYASIAYQFAISNMQYIKAGAGLTTSIVYSGPYPVLSYEYRF